MPDPSPILSPPGNHVWLDSFHLHRAPGRITIAPSARFPLPQILIIAAGTAILCIAACLGWVHGGYRVSANYDWLVLGLIVFLCTAVCISATTMTALRSCAEHRRGPVATFDTVRRAVAFPRMQWHGSPEQIDRIQVVTGGYYQYGNPTEPGPTTYHQAVAVINQQRPDDPTANATTTTTATSTRRLLIYADTKPRKIRRVMTEFAREIGRPIEFIDEMPDPPPPFPD